MARTLIGTRVREQRKALGLTQAALAARVSISPSYLNLIEGNRRNIAGALLKRIADALALPMDRLDGAVERRLADELRELAADPLLAPLALAQAGAEELAAQQPAWARALVSLHRACVDRGEAVNALSDRLNRDPLLGDAVHTLITHVAAIRSAAEILESDEALALPERHRFVSIVAGDSRRLSTVAQGLAGFFTRASTSTRSLTPAEEVDDFIAAHDNHFPPLEDAAEALRRDAGLLPGRGEGQLADYLARVHGVRLRVLADAGTPHATQLDPATMTLELPALAPEPTRRFRLARAAAGLQAGDAVAALLDAAPALGTPTARQRAASALTAYVAAAALMPYEAFHAAAASARYDIDRLARQFDASVEQVCHRLATLRRPGSEGIRFGFLRADPTGHVQKRFALPRLPLPRYGAACPLWPVYTAFQAPGATIRQLVDFPGGDRYLMVARAVDKDAPRSGMPRRLLSIMLVCDALHADRSVYGDGLDASPSGARIPVGHSCRICPRSDCAYRQEDPIIDAALDRVRAA